MHRLTLILYVHKGGSFHVLFKFDLSSFIVFELNADRFYKRIETNSLIYAGGRAAQTDR